MELKQIESLLEKYWEGETSISEENLLKDFFANCPVPPHLQKAAAVFAYYNEQQKIALKDAEFENDINVLLEPGNSSGFSWARIAAAVLLVCASAFIIYKMNPTVTDKETIVESTNTYEDPEKAFEETKKALLLISAKLNAPEKYTSEFAKINEASALFK